MLFPQNGEGIAGRLADASARVLARAGGPLLIVWPDLPRFRTAHAAGALDDLGAGCDVVLGPAIDGGLYLVGIARPLPELFALPEQTWRNDVMGVALTAIRDVGYRGRDPPGRARAAPARRRTRGAGRSAASGGPGGDPAPRSVGRIWGRPAVRLGYSSSSV